MIVYSVGWFQIGFIFSCQGSVFPFAFWVALPCALIAALLVALGEDVEDWPLVKPLSENAAFAGFQFLVGFVIVFRTSQSYARFNEALNCTHQMIAEWVDLAVNLAAFCSTSKQPQEEVTKFLHTIARLLSIMSASALRDLADKEGRKTSLETLKDGGFEVLDWDGLDKETQKELKGFQNNCIVIYQWVSSMVVINLERGVISVPAPICGRAFHNLDMGMTKFHDAMKMAKVPFPFPYAQTTVTLLIIHWILTPLVMAQWAKDALGAAVFSFVQVFILWSLNAIATGFEHPFGGQDNDIDPYIMQRRMNQNLLTILMPGLKKIPTLKPDACVDVQKLYSKVSEVRRKEQQKANAGRGCWRSLKKCLYSCFCCSGTGRVRKREEPLPLLQAEQAKLKPKESEKFPASPSNGECVIPIGQKSKSVAAASYVHSGTRVSTGSFGMAPVASTSLAANPTHVASSESAESRPSVAARPSDGGRSPARVATSSGHVATLAVATVVSDGRPAHHVEPTSVTPSAVVVSKPAGTGTSDPPSPASPGSVKSQAWAAKAEPVALAPACVMLPVAAVVESSAGQPVSATSLVAQGVGVKVADPGSSLDHPRAPEASRPAPDPSSASPEVVQADSGVHEATTPAASDLATRTPKDAPPEAMKPIFDSPSGKGDISEAVIDSVVEPSGEQETAGDPPGADAVVEIAASPAVLSVKSFSESPEREASKTEASADEVQTSRREVLEGELPLLPGVPDHTAKPQDEASLSLGTSELQAKPSSSATPCSKQLVQALQEEAEGGSSPTEHSPVLQATEEIHDSPPSAACTVKADDSIVNQLEAFSVTPVTPSQREPVAEESTPAAAKVEDSVTQAAVSDEKILQGDPQDILKERADAHDPSENGAVCSEVVGVSGNSQNASQMQAEAETREAVSEEPLEAVSCASAQKVDPSAAGALFNLLDADHSGTVDLEEMEKGCLRLHEAKAQTAQNEKDSEVLADPDSPGSQAEKAAAAPAAETVSEAAVEPSGPLVDAVLLAVTPPPAAETPPPSGDPPALAYSGASTADASGTTQTAAASLAAPTVTVVRPAATATAVLPASAVASAVVVPTPMAVPVAVPIGTAVVINEPPFAKPVVDDDVVSVCVAEGEIADEGEDAEAPPLETEVSMMTADLGLPQAEADLMLEGPGFLPF